MRKKDTFISGGNHSRRTFLHLARSRFRPFEIKSLRMNQNTGQIKEVNLLEE